MKIALLQSDIEWAMPCRNRFGAEAMMASAPGCDLYVLPEMFSTGFCTSPEGVAEPEPCDSLKWMKDSAEMFSAAIAGSVAVEENGRFFNRFYFVTPDGNAVHYDKRHLFTYGGEHLKFTAGKERKIVEYKGVRILLQVCYDLRFPVWSRNRGDYDMALYVASWPETRADAWRQLLKARAIENQCFVAGVNRIGTDPSNSYCGGTMLIDPFGKVIAECADGMESVAVAEISMEELAAFRQKFPVLDDADDFELV